MTTKEQERKALAQIKKIVESLGEGSYIATAFEGCFEIAESNIENDFGCSYKSTCESYSKKLETRDKEIAELKEEVENFRKKAEGYRADALASESLILRVGEMDAILDELRALKEENEVLMKKSADYIIDHIADRGSDSFNNAADVLSKQQSRAEHLRYMINSLQNKLEALRRRGNTGTNEEVAK